jgi:hypothetical protein
LSRSQEGQGQSKRHILVDTQGLVIEARVHSAKVVDRDGIKLLLEPARIGFLERLSHLCEVRRIVRRQCSVDRRRAAGGDVPDLSDD